MKALELNEELGNMVGMANNYSNLGIAFAMQEKMD
jgi:hypothetical protein